MMFRRSAKAQEEARSEELRATPVRSARRPGAGLQTQLNLLVLTCVGAAVLLAMAASAALAPGGSPLERLTRALPAGLVAASAAAALGLLLARRLQASIIRPLRALTRTMDEVREELRYDRAIEPETGGELGELAGGFNRMLAEIGADVAGLERIVAERVRELAAAKALADAGDAARTDLLAAMREEIRVPMTGLAAMTEMLAAGEAPPARRRAAEAIARSVAGLLAGLDDILDPGETPPERAPVDLAEMAEDVATLFWEPACAKGLDLAVYVDPATPLLVEGDPARLRQVIRALVSHAVRSTERGGVLVEIEPDSPATLRVSVRDTGSGTPKDQLPDLFARPESSLAACKRLVEAMGGRFNVTSEVGRGSTFAFRLPVRTIEPAARWPKAPEVAGRVRIAHDGVATRRALGRYLARAGYTPAGEGEAPDLFVGAPAPIEDRPPAAPTVCIARYGDPASAALLQRGEAQALLVQPFRREALQALLGRLESGAGLAGDGAEDLPRFARAQVLVAAGSALGRQAATDALAQLSVRAAVAVDAADAVEQALAERFDLILMEGSAAGCAATREIHRLEAERGLDHTPVIGLGAAAGAVDAGMEAVLPRPFALAALARTLSEFVEPDDEAAPAPRSAKGPTPVEIKASPPIGTDPRLIDVEVAASLAALAAVGKTDFVDKVRSLYRVNAPDSVAQLMAAVEAGDPAGAAQIAHGLKSMSLNIGAKEVARRAAEIEQAARGGALPGLPAVATLRELLAETLTVLGCAPAAPPPSVSAPASPYPPNVTITRATMPPETRALLDDLYEAIDTDQLSLVYQPQYDREGKRILGVETLVRWVHPVRGVVSPVDFIPVAEAWGRIHRLTDWVMKQAVEETKDLTGLQVAFNASALEFTDSGIVERIGALLDRTGFDPNRLEVEITETAILNNEDQVRENMCVLRERGLKVALDDFGAGYSSLGHLRRYPFDKLKIDREFVTDCTGDVQSATVVHAVVSIGRALGMKVVAEGVETEQQRSFLKIAGVHAMQGYLFGKPMPVAELKALVRGFEERRAAG
jgi:EAL domain-containing protein (putative c-di-GMP-specific phosphodiesterase class I)/signal transduction histidine kinase/HPt (histidine-containing phosphotransfer) domain-containing protein/CheY-like chemotaxis protein